jgi:glutamate racemase
MDKRPVLFMDSGIGGIPYCRYFHERNPNERIVYLADRLHFPYGNREREELVLILTALMEKVIQAVNPKIAVLACNTATVSAIDALRERFPALPFVGTVPAVKPAALAAKTGKVGVLGTKRTIEAPYIRRLAAENGNRAVYAIAAPELVDFVEHRLLIAGAVERHEAAREYMNRFRAEGVDAVTLGCTHFLFLLDEFRVEAVPDITVFDSVEGISRRAEALLNAQGGQARPGPEPQAASPRGGSAKNLFLLTGSEAPEPRWRQWAGQLGFQLSLLEER